VISEDNLARELLGDIFSKIFDNSLNNLSKISLWFSLRVCPLGGTTPQPYYNLLCGVKT
jgi:hypothetical protein